MVAATLFICVVSMMTWLHHFFTMGSGAAVNTAFGISTSIIAVGTGVKIYNWIFTMYGGRVRFGVPMLWSMGFIFTFVIGGMTGVLLAVPPADFLVHNSMFLVAHFHNVIVGGVVFALFAGLDYWFPKAFGFRLHEGWGKAAFWFAFFGFWITFTPLYILGLEGMTRRLQHINVEQWRFMLDLSLIGVGVLIVGAICQVVMLVVSILKRDELRDTTGDPWDGRSLEWATPSPPPFFNYAVMPNVEGEEAYWDIKLRAIETQQLSPEPAYEPIEMPVNSPVGLYTAFFATVTGFSLIWHIWWLAAVGLVSAFAGFVVFAWRDVHEFHVPVEDVARADHARRAARAAVLESLAKQGATS
jgi:cytochrome o ubiquinol oxidase subunit 1